jgi:hypothetical protein
MRACWERKPQALLMHALGPEAHWSVWLVIPATVLAIGLGVGLYPVVAGHPMPRSTTDWMLGFSMATMNMMILFITAAIDQQLRKTRGEQTLLRLTPLAGDAALLNRRIVAGALKASLASWVLLSASLLLLAWLIGGAGEVLLQDIAGSCLAGRLAVAYLLPRLGNTAAPFTLKRLGVLVLLGACDGALAYGLSLLGGSVWGWLVVVSAAACAVQIVRARRRLMQAPPLYPVEP